MNIKNNNKNYAEKKQKKECYQIAVIGAGASGIMAAISAARKGLRVLLLEQKERVGKKIPATGNGKCNFTNEKMELSCFRGNLDMVRQALETFSKEDTISFFQSIGISPKSKNGYYYPLSEQAASVLMALEMELEKQNVTVRTGCQIHEIQEEYYGYTIYMDEMCVKADKIILATGLLASPKLGSDGTSFEWIKLLGHHFSPIVPALCGFYAHGCNFKKISGVRTQGKVSVYINQEFVAEDEGEIQFTDYGISGIPVFQVSRYASFALYEKKRVMVEIDLLPSMTANQLRDELNSRKYVFSGNRNVAQMLNGLLNQKLIEEILKLCNIDPVKSCEKLTTKEMECLITQMKEWQIELDKARDYEFAQICAGGIRSEEVEANTLESKLLPGIFFCGELLDVDGICGGYNLQWAWSSGYLAAKSACDALIPKGSYENDKN